MNEWNRVMEHTAAEGIVCAKPEKFGFEFRDLINVSTQQW